METKEYLKYIVEEIHTTIVATVDDEGLPVTAAIDMMDYDNDSLYFRTAEAAYLFVPRAVSLLPGFRMS